MPYGFIEMKHRHPSGGDFLIVLSEHKIIKHPDSTTFVTDCSSQIFSRAVETTKAEKKEIKKKCLELHCARC